ncbi:hypothetical protein [Sporosarcina sp. 6E9]|uniref:hypothetical protein n=1 Tax=Sporosarcina sp. 6E9 TaxID=2819235 RepID=UPI001B316E8B|nr:hypothetical protein [Sporosarcina sp. 6E9]
MTNIKELAGLLVLGLFFSLFTWIMIDTYLDEYDLASIQSAEATVIDKTASKGLFTPPTYFVRVELAGGEEIKYRNRVSKSQIENIEIGDTINGYLTGATTFSTLRDILIDSFYYFIAIIVFAFISFCLLVAFFFSIPALERLEEKVTSKRFEKWKRMRKKKRKKKNRQKKVDSRQRAWRNAGIVIVIFLFIAQNFVVNLIRTVQPFGKTKTEATVVDRFEYTTYRRYEDSIWELTISYKNHAGRTIEMAKDVTRHTYPQYGIGNQLPISYRNADLYDVFVRGNSIWDYLLLFTYKELLVYLGLIAVSAFVIWAFLDNHKDKKRFWQKFKRKGDKK